ncbi:ATP-binding protein [bacterium]|nr:ATP-binding protein [bacterium]
MIFDGKSLINISDDEIESLVTDHVQEKQHIEFKLTINLKDDEDKLEVLRDITSLANSGGGYLIVGIRDDGSGKAMKFEPDLVGDTDKIRKSVKDLCLDHIQERILDLEVEKRVVSDNPIVIIRVPSSYRTPHMVSFQRHTDFWGRVDDGKREMKYAEIREMFQGDVLSRRLSSMESILSQMNSDISTNANREKVIDSALAGANLSLLNQTNGELLLEAHLHRIRNHAEENSFFCIQALPSTTSITFLDTQEPNILQIVNNPPGRRYAGWDLSFEHQRIRNTEYGLTRGRDDFRSIELWKNGYLELRAQIHADFCWGQTEEEFLKQPRFNPITLSEYVVSFLRFYAAVMKACNYEDGSILNLILLGIKGFSIRSLSWHEHPSDNYEDSDFILPSYKINNYSNPDQDAFEVLKILFSAFGYNKTDIPAWNVRSNTFEFETVNT